MEAGNEVFKLCKQVYEATGWGDTPHYIEERFVKGELLATDVCENVGYDDDDKIFGDVQRKHFPLYTSDYLLEKLPKKLNRYGLFELAPTRAETMWSAGYWTNDRLETFSVIGDTPLKALLKLTLNLHEEKML